MAAGTSDDWLQARDGPIQSFLRYYPERDDSEAKQMHAWADQVDVDQRERQLRNRMRMKITPDSDAERAAQSAAHLEEIGDISGAAERWQSLEKYKEAGDDGDRAWALLAGKRVQELSDVTLREKQLRTHVERARQFKPEPKPANERDLKMAHAMRAEQFGDLAIALRSWQGIKEKYQADSDARPAILLASKKIYELKDKAPRGPEEKKSQLSLLSKKLDEAGQSLPSQPMEAAVIGYDIVALYGQSAETEILELVAEARKLLEKLPPDLKRALPPVAPPP
jgi:hypothetical protein